MRSVLKSGEVWALYFAHTMALIAFFCNLDNLLAETPQEIIPKFKCGVIKEL